MGSNTNNTGKIKELQRIINSSGNIVFFGGAGVSTESGIPDFRGNTGLYAKDGSGAHTPEEMLHISFLRRFPKEFFDFYFNKMIHQNAQPNAAHKFLALLEQKGILCSVVTQNIDGLHQMAGSVNVIELHGSVRHNYCQHCKIEYSLDHMMSFAPQIPYCNECGFVVRPDIVLYGEPLDEGVIRAAVRAIRHADTLIVGGTSLSVYPAAGLIGYFNGKKLALINLTNTLYDMPVDLFIQDSVGKVFSQLTIC